MIVNTSMPGETPLHSVENREAAELLVQSISLENRWNFLLSVDENQRTALHRAAQLGKLDVVEYLCSLYPNNDELILNENKYRNTALHDALNREIAEVLMQSVTPERQRDLVFAIDTNQRTALHLAASMGRTDVVEFLCSFYPGDDELVLKCDNNGWTALHYAKSSKIANILIEKVTTEKRKCFISAVDNNHWTALHKAAFTGSDDVVAYLCSLELTGDELIKKKDECGWTTLHSANNQETAKLLVESIRPERQKDFILSLDQDQCTALHRAVDNNNIGVVKYLCGLSSTSDDLLLKLNSNNWTALHYAQNREMAELLVQSVSAEKLKDFLLPTDADQFSALHKAAYSEYFDVVKYLCSLDLSQELVLKQNASGWTALHYAVDRKTAELIVSTVPPNKTRDFVFAVTANQNTALHAATDNARTDVIEYLCSLYPEDDELILKQDNDGHTALHYAKTQYVAKLLTESVKPEKQDKFVLSVGEKKLTALHTAAFYGNADVVEYLCDMPQLASKLIHAKTADGSTALHIAKNDAVAKHILESSYLDLFEILASEDILGNSPFLSLVLYGRHEALKELLRYIEEDYDSALNIMIMHMQKYNKYNRNILHLAALSPSLDELYGVLQDYLFYADVKNMLYPDIFGNTPIHYVAAKYDTKIFANFMLHLPLSRRKYITGSANMQLINCEQIIYRKSFQEQFYISKVLCSTTNQTIASLFGHIIETFYSKEFQNQLKHPETLYRYDETILKVMKYSLNEYSLLDSAYTTSHTLFSLVADAQRWDALSAHFDQEQKNEILSEDNHMLIFIDFDHLEEPKQKKVQDVLNGMDVPKYSGQPKIAVIQKCMANSNLYIVPPGPDYLIILVEYDTNSQKDGMPRIGNYKSMRSLLLELTYSPGVQKVYVNSTLNKRFVRDENEMLAADDVSLTNVEEKAGSDASYVDEQVEAEVGRKSGEVTERSNEQLESPEKTIFVMGEDRGKALIICNNLALFEGATKHDKLISQLRMETLPLARKVLGNHFGLDVKVEQDLSAEDMLNAISQFSQLEGHTSIAVLTIFSHGGDGMIYGHDTKSKCSVQDIVNSLDLGPVRSIPKLMFLSCCRGDISAIYNRAPHSFESSDKFPWPENEIELLYKPTKRVLPDTEREEEWKRLTFQPLDIPADCYVCFTTLPDSRSKAGKFFKYFSDYLSQLTNSGPYQPTVSIDDILNDEAEPPMEVCSEYIHRLLLLEGASPSVQRVELVDLLTDVAGVLREKFQSKQYFNLCYSVNRYSKQVFIDVLPSCS